MSIIDEPPVIFFRKLFEEAVVREQVPVSDEASAYLVYVLAGRSYSHARVVGLLEPLGPAFLNALADQSDIQRQCSLQNIGDTALILTGFWWQYTRTGHDPQYHIDLGRRAYAQIDREPFDELSEKFRLLVDVFMEISSHCQGYSSQDVIRLYQAWMETQSKRIEHLLAKQGIAVSKISKSKH